MFSGKRWLKSRPNIFSAAALKSVGLPGVEFDPIRFTPVEIPNVTSRPKHQGKDCGGIFVRVTDRDRFEPVRTAVHMLATVRQLCGNDFQWRLGSIDRLSGTPALRAMIDVGMSAEQIVGKWNEEVEKFEKVREKYLMY